MTKTRIFGLSGKTLSGKDTTAQFIAQYYRYCFRDTYRYSFADALKEMTEILTGVKREDIDGLPYKNIIKDYTQPQKNIQLKTWGMSVGQMLQKLGTDVLRTHLDEDVWIKALETKIDNTPEGNIIVIPDMRFKNEADFILNKGGILIRLEGDPTKQRQFSTRDLNHISETDLDNYDKFHYTIYNEEFGLEKLEDMTFNILQKIVF